jgi:[ribosomal protein S5]-alanine N-acetyltransferase
VATSSSIPPVLTTARLRLVIPTPEAAPRVLAFYAENRAHLDPWSPPYPDGFFTEEFWRARLAAFQNDYRTGTAVRFVIVAREDPAERILGNANFSQIARGPFQACYLGYGLAGDAAGKGLMTEALTAAIRFAFDDIRLHRIMANYVPTNERSGRLLRRLGFTVEGYARDYLFIDGAWRDHVLTSLTNHAIERP